jgi:flagellum-specific ATP synthase
MPGRPDCRKGQTAGKNWGFHLLATILSEISTMDGDTYQEALPSRAPPRRLKLADDIDRIAEKLRDISFIWLQGEVSEISGLSVRIAGISHFLAVGDRVRLRRRDGTEVLAEITGSAGGEATAALFGYPDGLMVGAKARVPMHRRAGGIGVTDRWLGRVVDPLGAALDGKGWVPTTTPPRRTEFNAIARARLGPRIETGVRVIDGFATLRQGQRLGLFAGSGVGKSSLLSMFARHTACDIVVLALIGERGKEVRDFLEDDLTEDLRARAVTVVATSDAPPLLRREAAYTAMTVAEHFRDEGKSVLLMMDSITRFCLALREIGLAAGEPPATRGYPPSVFALLPRLLERAGPGPERPDGGTGYITGLFTVLVEGEDFNEPVADAVRGILDGHVVLDRRIAEGGRYPAVDVLRSISRAVPGCLSPHEWDLVRDARAVLKLHTDMADLIRLGAYRIGADPEVDRAIHVIPKLTALLTQAKAERTSLDTCFDQLEAALHG